MLGADAEKPSGYAAAGRTDAGVSALAQTVALDCPEWLTPRALNAELHDAVWAWAHADVPADFHATHHAVARTYVYHLYAPDADAERAREAARRLSGAHDFRNLTSDDAGTERDLSLTVERDGDFLVLTARAAGFRAGSSAGSPRSSGAWPRGPRRARRSIASSIRPRSRVPRASPRRRRDRSSSPASTTTGRPSSATSARRPTRGRSSRTSGPSAARSHASRGRSLAACGRDGRRVVTSALGGRERLTAPRHVCFDHEHRP
ncbi:tRNA pseudouridine synthase A [Halarchaeum acidiphilum MH1-52-1]|uniref:tRNA pseudouridine synthase A n=1 Tax=Halarchaeum acidiphilum MH1-52-1 TaxID=1261545 RepID=U3AG78_9EURY|nr:tRNA pseudouridine synthase A [Halarchaeum acidiphilum MH1-52-1]